MAKFILTLVRTKLNNKVLNFAQKQLFDTLTIQIFKESDTPWSSMTKEQRLDPYKVYEIEDTLEKCNKALSEWENIKFTKFNELKSSIYNSRTFRLLPLFNRRKLITPVNDSEYFEKFQNFLLSLGITINVRVEK